MKKHSPLQGWLNRTDPLCSFIKLENRPANHEFGGFLGIDLVVPVHESIGLAPESLENTWQTVNKYVISALELIDSDEPLWLDKEEVQMIKGTLGEPPTFCFPIYIFSAGYNNNERPVYIGRTSSSTSRFSNGHVVCTKLHHPQYKGMSKRLYLGTVVLLADDKEYQPLEWVHPFKKAIETLNSVEAQLIYDLKPELNLHHKNKNNVTIPITPIHIQNFTEQTDFLNDYMCFPP